MPFLYNTNTMIAIAAMISIKINTDTPITTLLFPWCSSVGEDVLESENKQQMPALTSTF